MGLHSALPVSARQNSRDVPYWVMATINEYSSALGGGLRCSGAQELMRLCEDSGEDEIAPDK